MEVVRILCWNLGGAWGRFRDEPGLHERAWQWIAAVDPDLAFLQEVRPPEWAGQRWQLIVGPHRYFASALLARRDFVLVEASLPADGPLDRLGSYLATAELVLAGGDRLLVSSIHTPAREARESAHPGFDRTAIARETVGTPWLNDVAFAAYRDLLSDRRFLIAGDWNTSRWCDEDRMAIPTGAEFFDRVERAGWVDVSLGCQGREGKTWYGSANPRPHQPDHAFADPVTAAAMQSFSIEPWPVTALGLSDHAPLLLELDLAVPEKTLPDLGPNWPAMLRELEAEIDVTGDWSGDARRLRDAAGWRRLGIERGLDLAAALAGVGLEFDGPPPRFESDPVIIVRKDAVSTARWIEALLPAIREADEAVPGNACWRDAVVARRAMRSWRFPRKYD
jgi:endonuclease/exonuclease/phosphatase family metal-dependent hydrolase